MERYGLLWFPTVACLEQGSVSTCWTSFEWAGLGLWPPLTWLAALESSSAPFFSWVWNPSGFGWNTVKHVLLEWLCILICVGKIWLAHQIHNSQERDNKGNPFFKVCYVNSSSHSEGLKPWSGLLLSHSGDKTAGAEVEGWTACDHEGATSLHSPDYWVRYRPEWDKYQILLTESWDCELLWVNSPRGLHSRDTLHPFSSQPYSWDLQPSKD